MPFSPHNGVTISQRKIFRFDGVGLMLQQTVIMIIGFYAVQWNSGIVLKFILIPSVTLIAIMGIYLPLIRPLAWVRVLFGMKQKRLQEVL